MRKTKFALFAVAAALFAPIASGTAAQAAMPIAKPAISEKSAVVDVRHGGRHHFRGGHNMRRHHGFRHHGFRHHRRYWGPRIYIAPTYNSCGWLKRRALNTGSRYWWNRYRDCRGY
ncbi:MAG: hypothetical protein ACRCS9_12125 [Hyphomicrobium sp.]